MKYAFCLGIRLNTEYQERICPDREKCQYYLNTNLSRMLSDTEHYEEVETYNTKECNLWKVGKE